MDSIYEARRQAVLAVIRDHFGGMRGDFARAANINPSYLSRMLKGPEEDGEHKQIGEGLARKMEDALAKSGTCLEPDAFVNPQVDRSVLRAVAPGAPPPSYEEPVIRDYLRKVPHASRRWLMEQAIRLSKDGAEPWPDSITTITGMLESFPPEERRLVCIDIQRMLQRRIEDQWRRPEPPNRAPPANDPAVPKPPTKRQRPSKS